MTQLSIIIPTCDRPETLRLCLQALQPLPAGCEVIVTDDGRSSANPPPMAPTFYQWMRGPGRGPAANRNAGAAAAQGAWVAFLDDDCQPQPGWAAAFLRAIAANEADVLEGKTVCPDKRDSFLQEQVVNERGDLYWSCNLALRASAFAELGGFDEDFTQAGGEDLELAWRIRHSSLRCRFIPDASVVHPARDMNWRRVWWRTFFIRWHLLYRIKTKQSPPPNTPALRVCGQLIGQQCIDLLRTTAHLVTRFDRHRWRSNLFGQLWRWFTFPILLPYLVYWELRYRAAQRRGPVGNQKSKIKNQKSKMSHAA